MALRLLQPELTAENPPAAVADRYSQAETILMANTASSARTRAFSCSMIAQELQAEMDLFAEWFVAELLGISLDKNEQQMLQAAL